MNISNPYRFGIPAPSNDNLLSYYRLESDALDYKGTNNGSPSSVTYGAGIFGNGAIFNGSTSRISLPANILNITDEFSVTFLVKANNTTAQYRVFSLNNNGAGKPYVSFRLNEGAAGQISVIVNDGVDRKLFINSYDVTQPIHLGVVVVQNSFFRLFVNGAYISQNNDLGAFNQVAANGNYLGTNRVASGQHHNGMLRGVGIWNKANTDAEMLGIYQKQLNGEHII